MSGIYVAAESWLNNAATNETRGKVLSAYMIAQTLGIIGAQGLLTLGDAGHLRALHRCLDPGNPVSFAPILLSVAPAPVVDVARPDGLERPVLGLAARHRGDLSCWATVYATQAGMGAVFGTQIGLTANTIALFVAMLFVRSAGAGNTRSAGCRTRWTGAS